MKHGAYIDISTIDGRTRHARWKRERTEYIAHLGGNPSTAERALIDRIVAKEWKCTQMEEAMARPFAGKFTRRDLADLLHKLKTQPDDSTRLAA